MSVNTYQNRVKQLRKDKNDLEKKANEEKQKEVKLNSEILAIKRTITKSSSMSIIRTRERQIETKTKELIKVGNRLISLQEEIRKKDAKLITAELSLAKAKSDEDTKRRDKELKQLNNMLQQNNDTSLLSSESLSDETLVISEDNPKTKAPRRGGPVPMPDDKKWAIVEGWLAVQGRVSQKDYCNSKGIGISTLRKWKIEYHNRFS